LALPTTQTSNIGAIAWRLGQPAERARTPIGAISR
jgi:hypothetical protein